MKPTTLLFAAALLFSALLPLAAQVPQIINCQGRISVSGAPFTGTGQFKFALVNATGSTTYWSHDGTSVAGSEPTGTVSLPVANGYYVAPLGDTGIAGMTAVPPSVFNNGDVRLRVWFNDGTKGMQLLSPDQRITSVGYAMMASTVPNGAITGGKLAEGTVNSSHLAIGAVQQQHIQPGAVQSFHLGANAITPDKVMANSINTSHLSGDAVNGEKWQPMSIAGAPSARRDHTAVWTGTRMLVWGGFDGATYLGDGALYHPTTNTWSPISATGAPGPRRYHSAVWTGTEMIVWGGYDGTVRLNDGGRYNPATDTWTPMAAGSLAARQQHTAVWTSTAMIVWGGYNGGSTSSTSSFLNSGEMYLPATDSWVAMATSPSGRRSHGAVWTGTGMIVHGGSFAQVVGNTGPPAFQPIFAEISASTGALFDPATNAWSPISSSGVNISGHCALWTGSRMLLWGSTSLSYDPVANTWGVPGGMVNAPTRPASGASAVWTGEEMLVWGGTAASAAGDRGGRYSPSLDEWSTTSREGAPAVREGHSAVWTGTQMIVWGGYDGQITRNDGGRYSPTSQMAASAVSNRNLADAAVTGAKIAEATITSDRLAPGIATPPGAVMAFAGTAAPTGWLLCNGNAVSRTTYATLFAAIGTTYGAGDGSTTFNLPDLLGRTIIGAGQGASLSNRTLAQKMGAETHTLSVSEMPSHTHGINDPGHSHTYARTVSGSSFGDNSTNQTTATTATSSSTTGITIQSAGGGAPHNNMQPSLVLNYIIKL